MRPQACWLLVIWWMLRKSVSCVMIWCYTVRQPRHTITSWPHSKDHKCVVHYSGCLRTVIVFSGVNIKCALTSYPLLYFQSHVSCLHEIVTSGKSPGCVLFHTFEDKLPPPHWGACSALCQEAQSPVTPGLSCTLWSTLSLPDMCQRSLILHWRLSEASHSTTEQ